MNTFNKIELKKIFEKIMKKAQDPKKEYINCYMSSEIRVANDTGCINFYSSIEPEIIIEKIIKYLKDFDKYDISIIYCDPLYFVTVYVYSPNYNNKFSISYIDAKVVKEIDNGFIYKYIDCYCIYMSTFDLVYISRKREILTFFCKGFSYETANRVYKKYTGKGLSKTTYLKYNLG